MNSKMIKVCLLLLIVIAVGCLVYSVGRLAIKRTGMSGSAGGERQIIESRAMFYEPQNFRLAVEAAREIAKRDDIYSIIVPHHLLASVYIAKLIKMSSGRNIKTVVVIGPNHENIGSSPIATVKAGWNTAFGYADTQDELVDKLAADLELKPDLEAFASEHSVGAIVPFIKYYLPQARIVPIIFSSYASLGQAEKVSQWLKDNLPADSLVIVSTDFSHYLNKEQADKNDEITRRLIMDRDWGKIATLDNDYVDSPISLATALEYAQKNVLRTEIIANNNSFNLSVIKPAETTSYFAIVFWRFLTR